ncbi:MAG: glycerol-3-phosphate acyltransferase [Thiotrichales bacterium]|nr:MAG: glycerol-3-phosphate acyltransferase [Thiotrichales bacterium]
MPDLTLANALMLIAAYLVGGISPGYILVRVARGIDLRTVYSGSLGATNAGRVLGRRVFYSVLAIDILKGFIIVLLARYLGFSAAIVAGVTVTVIAGHVWPAWFRFHGGKGIATTIGAFTALDFILLPTGGAVLLAFYLLTRSFDISVIATVIAMPIIALAISYPMHITLALVISAAIILIAHKDNILEALSASGKNE